jgi:hypothetical protein
MLRGVTLRTLHFGGKQQKRSRLIASLQGRVCHEKTATDDFCEHGSLAVSVYLFSLSVPGESEVSSGRFQ